MAIRYALDGNESDGVQILKFLETAKQKYLRSPFIREYTVSLLRGVGNHKQVDQMNRLIEFVRKNLTYVRDPEGSEYIVSPVNLLQKFTETGYMAGDCDDHTLLLNTMLGSIGISTKFIGVKFGPTDRFNHVISGIIINGQLYKVDSCAKNGPQPNYTETLIV